MMASASLRSVDERPAGKGQSLEALKEAGNDAFKRGDLAAATEWYSQCVEESRALLEKLRSERRASAKEVSPSSRQVASSAEAASEDSLATLLSAALSNRSLCRLREGRFAEAEEDSRASLELRPNYCKALYRHAAACEGLGDVETSVADLRRLLAIEPKNADGCALLAKLRGCALRERNAQVEESLPLNLAEKALDESQDFPSRVLAMQRLGAAVQSRGWQSAALRQGILLKVAVLLQTLPEGTGEGEAALEAASWMFVSSLLMPACGASSEAPDSDEQNAALVAARRAAEPLETPPVVEEARRVVGMSWTSQAFLRALRRLLRLGVSEPLRCDSSALDASRWQKNPQQRRPLRGLAATFLMRSLGALALSNAKEFEKDAAFLDAVALAIDCHEAASVQLAGLRSLAAVADARRRLGRKAPALSLRHGIEKCLEASLNALAAAEEEGSAAGSEETRHSQRSQVRFLVITVVSLLADKERPSGEVVDLQRLFEQLLNPFLRHLGQTDADCNDHLEAAAVGLEALSLFFAGDREAASQFVFGQSSLASLVLETATAGEGAAGGTSARGRLQSAAVEVLLHCLEFRELRDLLLQHQALPRLAKLAHRTDALSLLLRARLAVALARLSVHSGEVLEDVFEKMDFVRLLRGLLKQVLEEGSRRQQRRQVGFEHKRKEDQEKKQSSNRSRKDALEAQAQQQVGLCALELFYFLSLHGVFKKALLEVEPSSAEDNLLTDFLAAAGAVLDSGGCKGGLARYLVCESLSNLTLSREDKPKRRPRGGLAAGQSLGVDLDEAQLQELEKLYENLPEEARPQRNGQVDLGDETQAAALRKRLILGGAVKLLSRSCGSKPVPPSENALAASVGALCRLAKDRDSRSLLVRDGALAALAECIEALKRKPDEQREARQAAAQLCVAVDPSVLPYHLALGLVTALLPLLEDSHELLQYEGALALTNLASKADEACERLFAGGGWTRFGDLLFSDNPLLRAAALEGWVNMASCVKVREAVACKAEAISQFQDLRLMLAFSVDRENTRAQEAATAALATLTLDERIARLLPDYEGFANLFQALEESSPEDDRLLARLLSCLYNVALAVEKEEERTRIVQILDKNKQKLRRGGFAFELYEELQKALAALPVEKRLSAPQS